MSGVQIWYPHLPKMAVRDLLTESNPADPPLTLESKERAKTHFDEAIAKFGEPVAIATGLARRCYQSAAPFVARYGAWEAERIPIVRINYLAQAGSGDHDPENPAADKIGFVIYGPNLHDPEWYNRAVTAANMLEGMRESCNWDGPIYVVSSRPIVAAMRHFCSIGNSPAIDELDTLDKSLMPYCVFHKSVTGWRELSKDEIAAHRSLITDSAMPPAGE